MVEIAFMAGCVVGILIMVYIDYEHQKEVSKYEDKGRRWK